MVDYVPRVWNQREVLTSAGMTRIEQGIAEIGTVTGRAVMNAQSEAEARDAIGAASATGDSKALVAGDNLVLTDGADLTVSALIGEQGMFRSLPLTVVKDATVSTGTGILRLSYRRATKSGAFTQIRAHSGTTAAAATPTLCKMGVFSVASNGDLTRLARTSNDTALFSTISTPYSLALDATVNVVAGQLYAFGVLVITGTTPPTLHGTIMLNATEASLDERYNGSVSGQTDIISSISAGSVGVSTSNPYIALTA